MSLWRGGLWGSQRGGGGIGGEVVITESQSIPSLTLEQTADGQNPVVTASITDSAGSVDELRLYRSESPMDPQALPAPIVVLGAAAVSHEDDTVALDTTYYYRVASVEGGLVRLSAEVSVSVVETLVPDYANATIGDEIGGGIYAGIDSIGGVNYYIISGDAASEGTGLQWKTSQTVTSGTGSDEDGLANTQAMEAAGITEHPAAEHCVNYAGGGHNDWHMPARSQVSLMYSNLAGHAEFASNVGSGDYTWTSTERASSTAWVFQFAGAGESFNFKDNLTQRVRPIRRIPV